MFDDCKISFNTQLTVFCFTVLDDLLGFLLYQSMYTEVLSIDFKMRACQVCIFLNNNLCILCESLNKYSHLNNRTREHQVPSLPDNGFTKFGQCIR